MSVDNEQPPIVKEEVREEGREEEREKESEEEREDETVRSGGFTSIVKNVKGQGHRQPAKVVTPPSLSLIHI